LVSIGTEGIIITILWAELRCNTDHAKSQLGWGPGSNLAQSQTVCSGTWRPPVLTIALPGHCGSLPGRTFPRTNTVPKGPYPKLWMTGGRKPAANASATGASAPNAAVGTAKQTNTHTQKGGYPPRLCALILGAPLHTFV